MTRKKQPTAFIKEAGKTNGLTFDTPGFLLVCDGADAAGRCITPEFLNDLSIDHERRIFSTASYYIGSEPREFERQAVYRVNRDGRVIEITRDVEMPNGIAFRPDGETLYLGDHNDGNEA
jgi:sugar lactone lactonase YvrE